ncbi:MAG: TonB-dependent receptor, partial [Gammaproteobacteria bacterium]|nr:TonB-dependent receptor [Gammaproteobacteria bacterium]
MKTPIFVVAMALSIITTARAAENAVEEVVVVAHPLSGEGLSQAAEILEGDELLLESGSSLGETLATQPGVHSSSFGQASSRPVIHGLSGARIRVMEDRIDTLDASVTSADHAVTVESFIADRIEVLKGPSTLLYGAGAIGGVVDVHTGRIPHSTDQASLRGRAEVRVADNADRQVAAARLDGHSGQFAWHVDGYTRDADEYEIPGFAESAVLRASEVGEEEGEEEEVFGRVPGSQLESNGGAVGLSFVDDDMFAGFAVSRNESAYGLPGSHAHEPGGEEEGNPTLDMEQTRIDFEAGWRNPFAGVSSLNLRSAYNDYEHQEIEPNGEPATQFTNKAIETRFEFNYENAGEWNGAFGLQFGQREFAASGEEAFIPPVDTRTIGLFWVGERYLGDTQLETGFRVDSVGHDPSIGGNENFRAYGASLGMIRQFANGWQLRVLGDYAARAPVAEELYSDGPHLATQSFEVGNPDLDEETALNLSATLDYSDDLVDWTATAYFTQFVDFIYQRATGAIEDDLPVLVYTQDDVRFFGIDAEVIGTIKQWDGGRARVRAAFDTVDARIDTDGNDNLPRIPASRLGLGLVLQWPRVETRIDYYYVSPVGA